MRPNFKKSSRNAMRKKSKPLRKASFSLSRFGLHASLLLAVALSAACGGKSKTPPWEYMPNILEPPSLEAQEWPMRYPPAGPLPRGYTPYEFTKEENEKAASLTNPLPVTKEVLLSGQKTFNTYCIVCHGERGKGDGYIVPKFPRPPSLESDKIKGWADGQIFHVITRGQNLMPSYATQIKPEDRWAIIRYIRALQRADAPKPEDVELLKKQLKE